MAFIFSVLLHQEEKGVLLQKAIEALDISSVVVVSPSASGQYAIPYLMESRNHDKIAGYIPVAPVIEKEYTVDMFKDLKVGYPLRFPFTLTFSTSMEEFNKSIKLLQIIYCWVACTLEITKFASQ